MKSGMKEPYKEGLASHLGLESCADTARDSVRRRQTEDRRGGYSAAKDTIRTPPS